MRDERWGMRVFGLKIHQSSEKSLTQSLSSLIPDFRQGRLSSLTFVRAGSSSLTFVGAGS